MTDAASVVTYLSAASALFLSGLIIVAVARQKTHRAFQKHVLLFAISLLVCAVIANVLIIIYITEPGQGLQGSIQEGIVLSKRDHATFDYLLAITIGAFIAVASTTGI